MTGIDNGNAIGFIVCSSYTCLSTTQKYILTSMLPLFGDDIKENISMLFTFADGHVPPVLRAVKEANLPHIKHFKFNNSAIYIGPGQTSDDDDDEMIGNFSRLFWDLSMISFKKLLHEVNITQTKSLTLSMEVLDVRERTEIHVKNLHKLVNKGLACMEQLNSEVNILKTAEMKIDKNEDYRFTMKRFQLHKKLVPRTQHITTFLQRHFTWHENCKYGNDAAKNQMCSNKWKWYLQWMHG